MPNYQYACPKHGTFEKMVPMKDCGTLQPCPTCGAMCPREFVAVHVVTDTSLFQSDRLGKIDGARDNSLVGEHFRKLADEAGVVRHGKQYISQLADFPGDPDAYVDNRGDMVRVAKKKGKNIDDGLVKYKHESKTPPDLAGGLAADLAYNLARKIRQENPGMSAEKALNEAVDRHAPPGQKRIIKPQKVVRRKVPRIKPVNR